MPHHTAPPNNRHQHPHGLQESAFAHTRPLAWCQNYQDNDLMIGWQDSLTHPGTYDRVSGYNGQSLVIEHTQALDLRGLGGNDFISGEQYDDRLDGGDGDDLIWGGAGSDVILGGAGNDIIVSNMAATYLDDAAEIPTPAGYTRGADTVISYEGDPAYAQGRWWVERSDSGDSLRIQRAYMKNPDRGDGCIHYSKDSCQRLSIKRCRPFSFKKVWAADHSHVHESPAS